MNGNIFGRMAIPGMFARIKDTANLPSNHFSFALEL
jgi:hypothetical protein